MKPYFVAATLVLAALPSLAQTTQSTTSTTSSASPAMMQEATFVLMATQSNMTEVAMGQLALEKSANGDIKKHAAMMIADHNKAQLELNQTATVKASQELDAKHQAMVSPLRSLSGMEFDRKYVESQLMAHDMAVQLLSSYAQNGSNPALKKLAGEHLAVVQQHRAMTALMAPMVGATVPKS